MKSLGALWFALQPRQRLIGLLALAAVTAALIGLLQAANRPNMVVLYSGLEAAAAGEVVAAVEAMGVPVEASGAAVLVPEAERDRLRLALAADGLPRNGAAGYELLDNLDAFSTSTDLFEATYWRAKEGELARTILAAPGVRAARVHLANPVGQPFRRAVEPSASVAVTMGAGALSQDLAEAIRFMVSSAVPGLPADAVSVVDVGRGAVLRPGGENGARAGFGGEDREGRLRSEIERLLAARVGDGKAIVTVSIDTTNETETVVERLVDPTSRVAISSDTRTVEETSTNSGGQAATVASNLPDQEEGGEQSRSARNESQERVNYEISQTTRERVRGPGEVRRLSVAVLVDGLMIEGDDGEPVWSPRSEQELDQLRDLVKSAVGYDETRGDVVTVETLEFSQRAADGAYVEAGALRFLERNASWLVKIGTLGAVAFGLIFFVLRPLAASAKRAAESEIERLPPVISYGDDDDDEMDEKPADRLTLLRNAFAEQREDSASVLRSWLERDVQVAEEEAEARQR